MNRTISAKPQIFLLHYAGGDRNSFRPMIESLQPFYQVETPELPGRGERMTESFLTNKKEAVSDLLNQIKNARQKEVPYLIYGHSMGAILGLEICHAMESTDPVSYFVPTGYPGPEIKNNPPIAGLPRAEFFAEIRKLGGLSDELMEYEELLDFFEPVLRADFGLLESKDNVPFSEKIQAPVFAVMGKNEQYSSHIRNWENYTDAVCECQIVNGNHFFINQNFNYLARMIKNLMSPVTADYKHYSF